MSRGLPNGLRSAATALLAVVIASTGGFGTGVSVFGPETYRRGTGKPVTITKTFRVQDPSGEFTLQVVNHGVTSAVITLNGRTVLGPSDFTKVDRDRYEKNDGGKSGERDEGDHGKESDGRDDRDRDGHDRDDDHDRDNDHDRDDDHDGDDDHAVPVLERPVTLRNGDNQISVELRSKPGTWLTVEILRTESADRTPPTITTAISPPPNVNGWNNTGVTVSFSCADAGSGIASCPPPVVVTAEGANQVVAGTAVDQAGNTATATVALNIDKTPAVITTSLSPQANAAGWNNTDVTVTFVCADAGSGVAECPPPQVVRTEGAGQPVTAVARDRAGNVSTATVALNIDKSPPVIRTTQAPAANAGGWNNADVRVTFECSDDRSGVATCAEPQLVSTEGAGQVVRGTVTDVAGNTASASVTINLDKTPPGIRASQSPLPNANGWNNTPVTVTFACTDTSSGIDACSIPVTVADNGANRIVRGTTTDRAGNSASAEMTVSIDTAAPTIHSELSTPPNDAGWHKSDVTVSFGCADPGSGVAQCPGSQTISTDRTNQPVLGAVSDLAGNTASASVVVNLDKTPPVILALQSPAPNVRGWNNTDVHVSFECSDERSGLSSCTPPQSVSSDGANQIVTGAATDAAGNSASTEVRLNVDHAPPTIQAVLSAQANISGWHNRDVTVSFECADAISGIAQCSGPQLVSTEQADQQFVGNASDVAGNAASATAVVSLDKTAPVVVVTSPSMGATVRVSPIVISGSIIENGSGVVTASCGGTTLALSGSTFTCERPLTAGSNSIEIVAIDRAGNTNSTFLNVTFAPNLTPAITSQPPLKATEAVIYAYQVVAGDPDGNPLAFRLVTAPLGMGITPSGAITWLPAGNQVGSQDVVIEVSDGQGGLDRQAFTIQVNATVHVQRIDVTPEILRFSAFGTIRPLTVTGSRTDGTSVDLTASSETTFESDRPFVATVGPDGAVKAIANGSATITVHHQTFTDSAAVVVEAGVTLDSVDLTPLSSTLRTAGETQTLSLRGRFSDGETRDLTTAEGTTFESSDPQIVRVDGAGRVTAMSNGDVVITARHDQLRASAAVRVAVSAGGGFLRGQVLDDAKGLPLAGATVALLTDGGGILETVATVADERGRFTIAGRAGDSVVRVSKPGFTTVDRSAVIPAGGAATLLDARLTPVDARTNIVSSAFGGSAQNAAATLAMVVPPGGVAANVDVRLTTISAQGLQGRLPFGWSPVAAADISPAGLAFDQPAPLTIPNVANLPASAGVVVASYDRDRHEWVVRGTSQVSADGRTIALAVGSSGQFASLVADPAPFTPPAAVTGDALTGLAPAILPDGVTAAGEVVPRSAPPGDGARAVGRLLLRYPSALPSGLVLQAQVSERFDLTDQSQVAPQTFTEDIVLYSRGRPSGDGVLGASFPITPSRSFTIQELMRGVVTLDVTPPTGQSTASVVSAGGGTVSNAEGDTVDVSAGALSADAIIGLRRMTVTQLAVAVPAGFDLLAAIDLDLVGVTLNQPARLSMPAPASVIATDQLLLAMVAPDPFGVSRLRLVGVAALESGRIVSRTTLGTLAFPGAVGGGQYLFLRSQQPVGFLSGQVFGPGGATARALVTTDTAPFADTPNPGARFIAAGRAGADVNVHGVDAVTHDAATRVSRVNTRDEVVSIDLALLVVAPSVTATNPAANAVNVALDQSIVVDLSAPIDPTGITDTGVVLQASGASVAGQRTLTSDRRRLVFRPNAPLQGKTLHTLTLTGLRDASGHALSGLTTFSFTTLDPSKPTLGASGLISADLPDDDGVVIVTGGAGAAEANGPVVTTNLRTQESVTVLALADGSFRSRLSARIGDALALTLRDRSGRDTTVSLTQFQSVDGTTSAGELGGTVRGAGGRTGTVLPRALTQPGLFQIAEADATVVMPPLPGGFTYADQFRFSVQAAQFNRLASLTLSESQNRFASQSSTSAPFAADGELTVPNDFLANASLRFTATAADASGARRTASASTTIVPSAADTAAAESSQAADFPTVFVVAPRQSLQNQVVRVEAFAPAARLDLELPQPPGVDTASALLLVRREPIGGELKLAVVDTLERFVRQGVSLLRTQGHMLPGLSATGDYAVVASRDPIAFVTGRLSGPAAVAEADGLPFVFEGDGPNGAFALPILAGRPFTLRYLSAATGAILGSSSGQSPASGALNLGQPLASVSAQLRVAVDPDAHAVVDINTPLAFHFSEPVDPRTLATGIIVTDDAGARVFGSMALGADGAAGTFTPSRRWRFGTKYRWGVATSVVALSGARLAQQVSGDFTTFAPRVMSTTAVGAAAHDVAVAGALVVVATDSGLVTVDAASTVRPVVKAQLPVAGGARGIAMLPGGSFSDRLGATHNGRFAVVAGGDGSAAGTLSIVDVTAADAPGAIGSAQLTTGGGTPNAVALTSDQRALVAIQSVGVKSVQVSATVPSDASHPAGAVGPGYPPAAESMNHVALLGDRLLAVGAAGLTVLDATTLQRRGGISTTGNARAVASLPAFSVDLNGDGAIAAQTETFDLAAVANGADGTLQIYRVPPTGDPVLLSVVRFTGETTSVALDATERLAYVGLGVHGVALVDLDGPASVQPIDSDRNGVDDRILGIVDTAGSAQRLALALNRGAAFVANGPGGLVALQVLPPRTTFLSLTRDPIPGETGDEADISETREALTSDAAIVATIQAAIPEGAGLTVNVDGPLAQRLAFEDGSSGRPLLEGLHELTLAILPGPIDETRTGALRIRTAAGALVASLDLRLVPAAVSASAIRSLRIAPAPIDIAASAPGAQTSLAAELNDGRVVNVTRDPATTFVVADEQVATVSAGGFVSAVAGGTTALVAQNGPRQATAAIRVFHLPTLTALEVPRPLLTLTSADQTLDLGVAARFSDRGRFTDLRGLGVQFSSSDAAVATVDANGVIRATGEGAATITITGGSIERHVSIVGEFRTPPSLTGIDLRPFTIPASSDRGDVIAHAVVTGSGSLEGLTVTFRASDGRVPAVTAKTDYAGEAMARLNGLHTPGLLSVTASIVNPANGTTIADAESLVVVRAGRDDEPNDTPATAPKLAKERKVAGTLGPTDTRDMYRFEAPAPGTLTAVLQLSPSSDPRAVQVAFLSESGTELGRFMPTSRSARIPQAINGGATFVSIETAGAAISYELELRFVQKALTLTSVSPTSGGPGTAVIILGDGFTIDGSDAMVLFGDVPGKVVSASATRIEARVPARGVDGTLSVISGTRRVDGPQFAVGNAGPLPPGTAAPADPAARRFDPVIGQVIDVTRLRVYLDPLVTSDGTSALAARFSGRVVGENAVLGYVILEFPSNRTLEGLDAIRRALSAASEVTRVVRLTQSQTLPFSIDGRDVAHQTIEGGIFEALQAIRESSDFTDAANLKPVVFADIDSGFNPTNITDYFGRPGRFLVTEYLPDLHTGVFAPTFAYKDFKLDDLTNETVVARPGEGHGSGMVSALAAINNGNTLSGAFGGLFQPNEGNFDVRVYSHRSRGTANIDADIFNALGALATQNDLNVLMCEWQQDYASGLSPDFLRAKDEYKAAFMRFADRALVVIAAGNFGAIVADSNPAPAVSEDLPYVISVGDSENDARAIFPGEHQAESPLHCDPSLSVGGSNCGPGVTLAAPGEVLLEDDYPGPSARGGTSSATPLVAAIAGVLQAIRPNPAKLTTDELRFKLIDLGDDITSTWGTGETMRRLNALRAVRSILPASRSQMTYVVDQEAENPNGPPGRIVGIDMDPISGHQTDPPRHQVIPLTFRRLVFDDTLTTSATIDFSGTNPTSAVISPAGDRLFVVVKSVTPDLGDGILIVDTEANRAVSFVPLSGAPLFGQPPPGTTPVTVPSARTPLVISRDGRLLYVGLGTQIVIVNLVEEKIVTTLGELPEPYGHRASNLLERNPALSVRVGLVRSAVEAGVGGRAGTAIAALAMSPDGRVLYAAMSTGGGGGIQPGGLLAINVDLYSDADPATPGLQSKLSSYFTLMTPNAIIAASGDEPAALAVDKHNVYVVNGGLNAFFVASAEILRGTPGTFPGDISEIIANPPPVDPSVTVLSARGIIDVFTPATTATVPGLAFNFPSNVMFPWGPSGDSGGSVTNQHQFARVFAGRPFGIAINPSQSTRAIVPFYQTGNFGVMDTFVQDDLRQSPPPAAHPPQALASLSTDMFQAVFGVTQALLLDNALWPLRGAFSPGELGVRMPSPDENLMFPSAIEYAQNGKFAVGTHVGVGKPREVETTVPDLAKDFEFGRLRLAELGFTFPDVAPGAEPSAVAPDGTTFHRGQPIKFWRGGGAISILDDQAITNDFGAHDTQSPPSQHNAPRPYFSMVPLCRQAALVGGNEIDTGNGQCTDPVLETLTQYRPPSGGVQRLHRPRGVAIQPFVYLESPRFGDVVQAHTALHFGFRDSRIDGMRTDLFDLDQAGAGGGPALVGHVVLGADGAHGTAALDFIDMFDGSHRPVHGHRYRVEFTATQVDQNTSNDTDVSNDRVVLTFEEPPPQVVTQSRVTLHPALVPLATPGLTRSLEVTQTPPAAGSASRTVYRWIGGSSDPGMAPINADLSTTLTAIASKLTQNNSGQAVPFGIADISVNATSTLTASTRGLQIVQAVAEDPNGEFGGIASDYSVVLVGFTASDAKIEPQASSDTLTGHVIAEFGVGKNAPLVLAPSSTGFIDSTGHVALDAVTLAFEGGGTIDLRELMDALRGLTVDSRPVIEGRFQSAVGTGFAPISSTPTWRYAQAVNSLQRLSTEPPLPSDLGLTTSGASIANVSNEPSFRGSVIAGTPGFAAIDGTVDLGGFGTARDGLMAWVLPALESAAINPPVVAINRSDAPQPGPSVRTHATTQATTTSFQRGYATDIEALRHLLPEAFDRTATFFAADVKLTTDPQITITGHGVGQSGTIQFNEFRMGFDVPADAAPAITSAYSVVDQTIATLGAHDRFAQHLVHQNQPGTTKVENAVHVDGLGNAHASAEVIVCDCNGPVLSKRLLGPAAVQPGDHVSYEIVAVNPTTSAVSNVVITDDLRLNGVTISSTAINAGTIDAGASQTFPFNTVAPAGGGTLQNTVSAPGFAAFQPPPVTIASPTGGLIVTELVVDPKQDWSDSTGGNGVPFDGTPGTGVVDAGDIWVELFNTTTGNQNWTVRLTDATGATASKVIGPPVLGPQVRLLTGFGALTLPINKVEVVDQSGVVRQTIDVAAINAILGPATDASNEALAWSTTGSATLPLQQLLRRPATIGFFSPF